MPLSRVVLCSAVLLLAATSRAAAADEAPSFTKDIQPFLKKYCVECHGAKQAKAGYNFDTYRDLMKGSKKGSPIVVGKPDTSLIVKTLVGQGKQMPPKKSNKKPTEDEVALVKKWIMAGAKDDTKK